MVIVGLVFCTFGAAYSAGHAADESFSAFNERYTQFFEGVQDLFEVRLKNHFSSP
jgi:hypothetical protein